MKFKKITAILLMVISLITLMACGKAEDKPAETTEKKTEATKAESTTVEESEDATESETEETSASEAEDEEEEEEETTAEASSDSEGAKAYAEADKIIIGGLAPLSGNVSIYGIAVNNAVKLAFEEINEAGGIDGKKVEFISYDTKGDTTEAGNAYEKLLQDGMVILIGDVTSTPTLAVAQKAARDNVPMITATGTAPSITAAGSNVFRTCFTDSYQGSFMAKYAKENLELNKVAIIYDAGNDYCVGLTEAFIATAEEVGMEIVAQETYAEGDVDFKAQLTKIQQAKPDGLYVPDYYGTDIQIIRQARAMGMDIPLMGGDGWDGVLMEENIGEVGSKDADNTYFTNHYSDKDPDEKVQAFLKDYKDVYGIDAVSFAALGYDTAYIVAAALEKAQSFDADDIIAAMNDTDYEGITGRIRFDEAGDPIKSVVVVKIEDGDYQLFEKVAVE